MPSETALHRAAPDDLPTVMAGLRALAADLGDPFRVTEDSLRAMLWGASAYGLAILAGARGLALAAPVYSTSLGGSGAHVSDLWVAADMRGEGLGARLLAAVAREARQAWDARFLKLVVYDDNHVAGRFYDRLGFRPRPQDRATLLSGPDFDSLAERAA